MDRRRIDRKKTCPLLLRVFWKEEQEISPESLKNRGNELEQDEVRLYTWKDATFREIADMLKEHIPGTRRKNAELNFYFIRPNLEGGLERKDIGTVNTIKRGEVDFMTLNQLRFVTGDYLGLTIKYTWNNLKDLYSV
ncbi:unnamed protein product [Blepharisma stoltei]|uniref:Histone deacetylase complex subunit SAP18 n=1 Tax=Blepharisma stoltei TaxID=1481888 RepID=A0AAU9JB89_9CILI|nr:unnamed protein product [Blepharisma stoltei]